MPNISCVRGCSHAAWSSRLNDVVAELPAICLSLRWLSLIEERRDEQSMEVSMQFI